MYIFFFSFHLKSSLEVLKLFNLFVCNGTLHHSFGPLGENKKFSFHLTWLTKQAHLSCMLLGTRQSQGVAIRARQQGHATVNESAQKEGCVILQLPHSTLIFKMRGLCKENSLMKYCGITMERRRN